jgi:hypothetical protein
VPKSPATPATEPPQGVLPHCPAAGAPALLFHGKEFGALGNCLRRLHPPGERRFEMSTITANHSLSLLPIVLGVSIVIGDRTG